MLTIQALEWLKGRGITQGQNYGLRSANGGDWIAYPFMREGKAVNHKYRHLKEKKFQQDKDATKLVWNEDCLRDKELTGPIIITEGEMDALSAIEAGYLRVVSVPDGAPNERIAGDSAKYNFIPALLDLIRGETEIILAPDGDGNGQNLLHDLAYRLGKARCKYVTYPKGCKDLNDALMKYGVKGVTKTVSRAQHIKVTGLAKLKDIPPAPELEVFRPNILGKVDRHIGICPGHFSVWTGIPGGGKTTFLRAVCIQMATAYGWNMCIASFEDTTSDYRREVAKYLADAPVTNLTDINYQAADLFLDDYFSFVLPDYDDEPTLEWMIERMETAAVRYGSKMFVIDPWSELDHQYSRSENETQYVSRAISTFRRFARRFNVHVALVAHPKMLEPDRKGVLPIPSAYSISGSAHWFNKPELVVVIHRVEKDDVSHCLVRVVKSKRHDIMGKPGDIQLHLNWLTGRYSDFEAPKEHGDYSKHANHF